MAFDLKIVGGLVITDGSVEHLDLGIEGGAVAEIGPMGSLGRGAEEIDATDRYVLPGAVDAHFHCRAPSHPERGDFASETKAAAAGGVTTVFEMPISDPACSTPEVFQARREVAESQSVVDFGLYAGGAVRDEAHAASMAELGAVAYKLFTHAPPPDRVREFDGLCATDEVAIYRSLEAISATGLPCVVHAENEALLRWFASMAELKHVPIRPPVIESTAIAMVGTIASAVGARVHIAHLTSMPALQAIRGARASGVAITAETCPHYLVFDEHQIARLGAFAKVAPPLRPAEHLEALWQGLAEGLVSIVASDHAPFLPEEKERGYALAPHGIPTVETMFPIMLDAAARGILPLTRAVDLVTSAPARLFGVHPRKGTLSEGADADVVVFAPASTWELDVDSLLSRSGASGRIYEGLKLQGRIERTIVRGRTVFRDGIAAERSGGRFVAPSDAAVRES